MYCSEAYITVAENKIFVGSEEGIGIWDAETYQFLKNIDIESNAIFPMQLPYIECIKIYEGKIYAIGNNLEMLIYSLDNYKFLGKITEIRNIKTFDIYDGKIFYQDYDYSIRIWDIKLQKKASRAYK